jgi:hypothetical protein
VIYIVLHAVVRALPVYFIHSMKGDALWWFFVPRNSFIICLIPCSFHWKDASSSMTPFPCGVAASKALPQCIIPEQLIHGILIKILVKFMSSTWRIRFLWNMLLYCPK